MPNVAGVTAPAPAEVPRGLKGVVVAETEIGDGTWALDDSRVSSALEESLAAAGGRSASPSGACGTGGFTPKAKPSPASRSSAPLSAPDPPGGSRRDGHWTAYVSLT